MASINFAIPVADRDAICLRCPLADCVGIESRECPIQVEQRKAWRNDYERRKAAGYFARRAERTRTRRAHLVRA